ncbi:hypothetical protein BJ878DRAFT_484095 [Calycina marina]|uniref:Uncharacterized protein n=1 Tax=Calycina marina TaxID=1763456 RepID=A0A9P8CB41_9HELO|nr:hypothetical protein BJ878DRAFT_484095 [Calycina marina]
MPPRFIFSSSGEIFRKVERYREGEDARIYTYAIAIERFSGNEIFANFVYEYHGDLDSEQGTPQMQNAAQTQAPHQGVQIQAPQFQLPADLAPADAPAVQDVQDVQSIPGIPDTRLAARTDHGARALDNDALQYLFDLDPPSRQTPYTEPPHNNADSRGIRLCLKGHDYAYLMQLVEAAVVTLHRPLLRCDFHAITEALHRGRQPATGFYRLFGYHNMHSKITKDVQGFRDYQDILLKYGCKSGVQARQAEELYIGLLNAESQLQSRTIILTAMAISTEIALVAAWREACSS